MENFRRADAADEGALIDRGETSLDGRTVRVIESVLPPEKEKGYYCYRCVVSFDTHTGLPVKIQVYDWQDQLVEDYEYRDLEINPGLTDADFDRNNSAYNF